jgi:serine protease Do
MNNRNTKILTVALMALLVAIPVFVFSSGRAEKASGQSIAQSTTSSPSAVDSQALADATKSLSTIQLSFREVAQKVLPVVVEVDVVEQASSSSQTANPFDWFFNQTPNGGKNTQPRTQTGLGSGIIVQKSGGTYYVLTNNHVVDQTTSISIKLQDQTVFDNVKVVGKDARRDLAIISFTSKENLAVADLGDSSELQVGDLVLAVGNPFGFENTVTMGIISALGRTSPTSDVATNTDYIQTDASINQGNSGGALVNIKGEVIGINTWIAAPTGGSIGLGFAIPINNAKKAISDFINKGKVEYGWLGVQPYDPTVDVFPGVAKDLKVENLKGALVVNVFKGSPAEKAGLLPGDYVTKVNGQDIANTNKLIQIVGDLLADKSYDFELYRNGEKMKISVKLGARPADGDESIGYKYMWPGLSVAHVNDQVRQSAGDTNIPKGVDGIMVGMVYSGAQPGEQTPAAIAGLKSYDMINQINGKDIHTTIDFYKALNDKAKKEITLKITRDGNDVTITLPR